MGRLPTPVVFLTDYGLADPFVGLCHAVIAGVAPGATVIDLTHAVGPQDVRQGATLLADSQPWLPPGAVVLAVVDPGVGTDRRALVVAAGDGSAARLFVGPDNGLLVPAAESLGGAHAAWALPKSSVRRSTFDGRDVFAPAAARLALGAAPEELGDPVDPATLVPLVLPGARVDGGTIDCEVLHVDGFGNLQLSAEAALLDPAGISLGSTVEVRVGAAIRDAEVAAAFATLARDRPGVLPDAFGRLQIVVNRGSAARLLGGRVGDRVRIRLDGGA